MKNSDQLDIRCVFQFKMSYLCYHCPSVKAEDQKDLIDHSIKEHPTKKLSLCQGISVQGERKYKSLHYQILPSQHVSNNLNSNILQNENESPIQKGAKYATPQKVCPTNPLELIISLLLQHSHHVIMAK